MSIHADCTYEEFEELDGGQFVSLVVETILYEWARTCAHHNSVDPHSKMVRVEFAQFAKWYRIAMDTCGKFRRYFPGCHFGRLLGNGRLRDPQQVRASFLEGTLVTYEFFPNLDSHPEMYSIVDAFYIPPMDGDEDNADHQVDFMGGYRRAYFDQHQEMTALIVSSMLKKWRSDALDREPAVVWAGQKVLYRLMPSYSRMLNAQAVCELHCCADPPTPREAYDSLFGELEETLDRNSNNDSPAPAGSGPLYDLYGLNPSLKRVPTDTVNCQAITLSASRYYNEIKASRNSEERRSDLIRRLQAILNQEFPDDDLRIEAFGSAAIGLGTENSDLDLCITTPRFDKYARYNNVSILRKIFQRHGMHKLMAIAGARVPIVKFQDPITWIKVDVNCNHVLGVHNSQLIKTYMQIDSRLPQMLYILKALIKVQGIHDSSQGFLSSYTVVMMAIAFLQLENILPNLQSQHPDQMDALKVQLDHDGSGGRDLIDCTFDRNWRRYKGFGAGNPKSLGQLLFEFFEFFAREFNYPEWEVNIRLGGVCGRGGVSIASTEGRTGPFGAKKRGGGGGGRRRRAEFVVMDPFLRQRNVAGTCMTRNLPHVWTVFDYLYKRLGEGDWAGALRRMPWPLNDKVYESSITTATTSIATNSIANTSSTITATTTLTTTSGAAPVDSDAPPKRNRRRKNKDKAQPLSQQQQAQHHDKPRVLEFVDSPVSRSGFAKTIPPEEPMLITSSKQTARRSKPFSQTMLRDPEPLSVGYIEFVDMKHDTATTSSSQAAKQTGRRSKANDSQPKGPAQGFIGHVERVETRTTHGQPTTTTSTLSAQQSSTRPRQTARRSVPFKSQVAVATASLKAL